MGVRAIFVLVLLAVVCCACKKTEVAKRCSPVDIARCASLSALASTEVDLAYTLLVGDWQWQSKFGTLDAFQLYYEYAKPYPDSTNLTLSFGAGKTFRIQGCSGLDYSGTFILVLADANLNNQALHEFGPPPYPVDNRLAINFTPDPLKWSNLLVIGRDGKCLDINSEYTDVHGYKHREGVRFVKAK